MGFLIITGQPSEGGRSGSEVAPVVVSRPETHQDEPTPASLTATSAAQYLEGFGLAAFAVGPHGKVTRDDAALALSVQLLLESGRVSDGLGWPLERRRGWADGMAVAFGC